MGAARKRGSGVHVALAPALPFGKLQVKPENGHIQRIYVRSVIGGAVLTFWGAYHNGSMYVLTIHVYKNKLHFPCLSLLLICTSIHK